MNRINNLLYRQAQVIDWFLRNKNIHWKCFYNPLSKITLGQNKCPIKHDLTHWFYVYTQYFFNIQVLIFKLGNIKSNYNQVPRYQKFFYTRHCCKGIFFYPTKQFSQCVSLVKWFKCNKNIHTRIKQSYKFLSNSLSNLPYGICYAYD